MGLRGLRSGISAGCVMFAACALAALLLCAGCSGGSAAEGAGGGSGQEGIAARFGDHVIYEDDVTAYTERFRAQHGYEKDSVWASYLSEESLTAKAWREEAIREIADRMLIRDKADELGITPDSKAVEERLAASREAAGAGDDDKLWADYLAETGQTPDGLREDFEFTSLEQQVFTAEIDFTTEMLDAMCDDYIHVNLADQVLRRYSALAFGNGEDGASDAYAELSALQEDERAERLDELADGRGEASGDASTLESGDIGWDFLFDESTIDPDLLLRKAMLQPGALYSGNGGALAGTDGVRVVLCTERVNLEGMRYADIPSESLKSIIADLAKYSNWAAECKRYLSQLEEAAGIQVAEMPSGLPYDVE